MRNKVDMYNICDELVVNRSRNCLLECRTTRHSPNSPEYQPTEFCKMKADLERTNFKGRLVTHVEEFESGVGEQLYDEKGLEGAYNRIHNALTWLMNKRIVPLTVTQACKHDAKMIFIECGRQEAVRNGWNWISRGLQATIPQISSRISMGRLES
jgi:hypothetical protein